MERAPEIEAIDDLDFTYLFHKHTDNPAFRTMGEGVPIRSQCDDDFSGKDARSFGEEIEIEQAPRLARALNLTRGTQDTNAQS